MNIVDPIANYLGEWASTVNILSVLVRLALPVIAAAIIGCERSSKRHAAGLRTFMLASFASACAMLIDMFLIESAGIKFPLVSAASLVGAATISSNSILFSSKNQIKGLTTAVALWACSILGLTAGAGFYTVTVIGFVALYCCLSLFPSFERYLKNRSNHFEVHLELTNKTNLQDFVTTLRKIGVIIDDIEANAAYINSGLSVYTVSLTINSPELKKYKTHKEIIEALSTLDYVYYIEEMN
ncbi:MAG: MgtC/SapB family protein [Ruminococcaceae bacterium]|nr:MgtC/SapB family protein [Oscillospiraceae bacterium]